MRLSESRIKAGVLHPERDVRDRAVRYFSESHSGDLSVMPLVIQAVEKHGWSDALPLPTVVVGLPLSNDTLKWAVRQLQGRDLRDLQQERWQGHAWLDALWQMLQGADAHLLAQHQSQIRDIQEPREGALRIIKERVALLAADGETCWRKLEEFCVEARDVANVGEVDLDHAYALIEAIAREKDRFAERTLRALSGSIEDVLGNPRVWMETFAVRMAGEMRLEAAVPLIVVKLMEVGGEAEWLAEQCRSALVRIGGDVAAQAVADLYRQGNEHLRLMASDILQKVHSDLAVANALEWLPGETDPILTGSLSLILTSQFAEEGIEPVRQVILDGRYDERLANLKRGIVAAATLLGVPFPEREQWKAEVDAKQWELEKIWAEETGKLLERIRQLDAEKRKLERELRRAERERDSVAGSEGRESPRSQRIGRNDPCPCGSGKKYKRCCMKGGIDE